MMYGDQPAALLESQDVYVAFDSMISGTPWPMALRYGRSPGLSALWDAVIVSTYRSVLWIASPIPGKCFMVALSPPATRPDANASASCAVSSASKPKTRPCWYMNELVETGTSATGARSVLMPRACSAWPVFLPWLNPTDALPMSPICGTVLFGGIQAIRLTDPPSW